MVEADFYCLWDDDDLYTPFRITESVYFAKENPEYDIIKTKDAFISIENKKYKVATNRFHGQAMVKKDYVKKTNYPLKSIGEDAGFEKDAKIFSADIFPSFWCVVRHQIGTYQISQVPNNLEKKSWEYSATLTESTPKEIALQPKYKNNYWQDIRNALNNINGFWGEEFINKCFSQGKLLLEEEKV